MLAAVLALMLTTACGGKAIVENGQLVERTGPSIPPPITDAQGSVDACTELSDHFAGQGAVLRGAFRSPVATVAAWRIGGGFPEAVPQFLQDRPATDLVYVCFLDMDIAAPAGPAPGGPGYNRGLYLLDSSGNSALLIAGQHDIPGTVDLPVVSPG